MSRPAGAPPYCIEKLRKFFFLDLGAKVGTKAANIWSGGSTAGRPDREGSGIVGTIAASYLESANSETVGFAAIGDRSGDGNVAGAR